MVHNIIWKATNVTQLIKISKSRHWTLSWASRIQFAPSIPISLRYILMLSSHLRLGLPIGLFSSTLPNKTL
jgi:hypothetical protein